MAETTKKTVDNATKKEVKKVKVKIPLMPGEKKDHAEFFSVNGRNYRIQKGIWVEVPEEIAEVIENGEKAEDYAMEYIDNLNKKNDSSESKKALNI